MWRSFPGLPRLYLHTASDQILEVGTAWERGYWLGALTFIHKLCYLFLLLPQYVSQTFLRRLLPGIGSKHNTKLTRKSGVERVCSCLVVYKGSCELDVRFEERINPQKNGGPDGIGTQDFPNTTLPVSRWTNGTQDPW